MPTPKPWESARANVARIGLGDQIEIVQRELIDTRKPGVAKGLLAVNPPYGERLGDQRDLTALYGTLGHVAKTYFGGWRLALFSAAPKLAQAVRLRPRRSFSMRNGALKCRLLSFELNPTVASVAAETAPSPGKEMLAKQAS